MTDKKPEADAKKENTAAEKQISVNAQYIKDLSFENPKSPASLMTNENRPNIDISVDVVANKAGDDLYEVALMLNAKAEREEEVLFVAELAYAGVFTVKGINEQELEQALLIFCPSMLFPYARRILSDVTRDGGFPPLMLDPIDFGRLYQQKIATAQAEKNASDKKAS
jgi:preprotein translocase subunit SecB